MERSVPLRAAWELFMEGCLNFACPQMLHSGLAWKHPAMKPALALTKFILVIEEQLTKGI